MLKVPLARIPSSKSLAPISIPEFVQLFQRCRPPNGWHPRIVVANSGGPDSVCLLYLLFSAISRYSRDPGSGLPTEVCSSYINHRVQEANTAMAATARAAAREIQTRIRQTMPDEKLYHIERSVPWGRLPFPPRPPPGTMEETCRQARSALLLAIAPNFPTQTEDEVQVAFAHHADDQVETAIMRAMKGSKDWGISGMKRVRRWGMGDSSDIRPAGLTGMRTWVIRPLLDIPKDRILATCEANKLEYVLDPTNFQPELTLRNYVRDHLSQRELQMENSPDGTYNELMRAHNAPRPPVDTSLDGNQELEPEQEVVFESVFPTRRGGEIERAIAQICPGPSRLTDIREAVRNIGQNVEKLEVQALNALQACVVPDYMRSKLLLRPAALRKVTDPAVQEAIVRRILRYVSPKPWGSLASIAHARRSKIDAIITKLWDSDPTTFSLGAEVLWQPVVFPKGTVEPKGPYKLRHVDPEEPFFWLVERAPPTAAEKSAQMVVSQRVLRGQEEGVRHYLFDNRFDLAFNLSWGKFIWTTEVLKSPYEGPKRVVNPIGFWKLTAVGANWTPESVGKPADMDKFPSPATVLARGDIVVALSSPHMVPEVVWRCPGQEQMKLGEFRVEAGVPSWHGAPWISCEFVRDLYGP